MAVAGRGTTEPGVWPEGSGAMHCLAVLSVFSREKGYTREELHVSYGATCMGRYQILIFGYWYFIRVDTMRAGKLWPSIELKWNTLEVLFLNDIPPIQTLKLQTVSNSGLGYLELLKLGTSAVTIFRFGVLALLAGVGLLLCLR